MERLEPVNVDRWAALYPPRERKCVGVGAWAPSDSEGSIPPRPQLADIGGVDSPSSSSLVRSSTRSSTSNTVSTRPASSLALRACCAAAKSSLTVISIVRIRRA